MASKSLQNDIKHISNLREAAESTVKITSRIEALKNTKKDSPQADLGETKLPPITSWPGTKNQPKTAFRSFEAFTNTGKPLKGTIFKEVNDGKYRYSLEVNGAAPGSYNFQSWFSMNRTHKLRAAVSAEATEAKPNIVLKNFLLPTTLVITRKLGNQPMECQEARNIPIK